MLHAAYLIGQRGFVEGRSTRQVVLRGKRYGSCTRILIRMAGLGKRETLGNLVMGGNAWNQSLDTITISETGDLRAV